MMLISRRSKYINKCFFLGAFCFSLTYFYLQNSPTAHVNVKMEEKNLDERQEIVVTKHDQFVEQPVSPFQLQKPSFSANIEISPIQPMEADQALREAGIVHKKDLFIHHQPTSLQPAHIATTSKTGSKSHPFNYVIHPGNVCSQDDIYLFIYIHSAPSHYKHRLLIRQTWGNPNNYIPIKVKLVFVLGVSLSEQMNSALRYEADMYKDIVQENFIDAYKNLTYKGLAGLRYTSENCQNARFVMKTDDDVVVNVFALLLKLQSVHTSKLIMCLTWYHMKVMREPKSKWYVSKSEWEPNEYPPYCSGSAFVLSPDVAKEALRYVPETTYFWVDDLYITGLLAKKAGITNHLNIRPRYELNLDKFDTAYDQKKTDLNIFPIFTHARSMPISRLHRLWDKIVDKSKQDTRWKLSPAA